MYRDDDRRAKQDGTHLECTTRVRFTEDEDQELLRMAVMYTAGRKAPWIRRCALLGQKVLKVRNERLLAALVEGRPLTDAEHRDFAMLIASLVEDEATDRTVSNAC